MHVLDQGCIWNTQEDGRLWPKPSNMLYCPSAQGYMVQLQKESERITLRVLEAANREPKAHLASMGTPSQKEYACVAGSKLLICTTT